MKARWTGADEVFEVFARCTTRERRELISCFNSITEFPENSVDHTSRGAKGRTYLVAHVGKWAVAYWVDAIGDYVHFVGVKRRG